MANARLFLEHVDTGDRIMIARLTDVWSLSNLITTHDDEVESAPVYAETTETRSATTARVWRLVYEDMEPETMPVPENRAERG